MGGGMKFDEFAKFQSELLREVVAMGDTKGKEYANSQNRFANFERTAASLNLYPSIICIVFMTKHWDSINNYIKEGARANPVEPIRGRIVDLITYLTLLAGMIEEERKLLKDVDEVNTRIDKVRQSLTKAEESLTKAEEGDY